jgi:hypothetical protein
MARTKPCNAALTAGRLRKAQQFMDQAEAILDLADDQAEVADAYVTLCAHAGIAAADVICCRNLGEHAYGDSHHEAVQLLRTVRPNGPKLAQALNALLTVKTRAGYSSEPVTADQRKRAGRAARQLVDAARA